MRPGLAVAAALVAFLAGCGGGSSGGGGGNGGSVITSAQRSAALTSAGDKYSSLASLSPAEANQQMAAWLKAQPLFEASGVSSDGCAWGRFTDGRLAIFVNNRTPGRAAAITHTRAVDPPSNLPGTTARVGDNLGQDYGGYWTDIFFWLDAAGYKPSLPGRIDEMMATPAMGLLALGSHGGSGVWRDGTNAYAIWGSPFDIAPDNDEDYKADLDDRRLCYMYADAGYGTTPKTMQWRYAFTAKFVMQYMSFSPGSFVFIDACSSDEPVMRAAFLAKGASVYAGWSSPVNSDKSGLASQYLFDRLLAADKYNPESPKQRSFDWKSVYAWMQEHGYDIGKDGGGCYLKMTAAMGDGNGFGLLAPSIMFMFAHDYEEKLYLYGLFGDNPGSDGEVTVGGSQLQVLEWARDSTTKMDRIVAKLPFEGAGSFGDVKVTVRKHQSNVRQLSFYQGDFKLRHETGDGRKYVVTHHLRFRVDLQSARMKPGDAPAFTPMNPQRVFADDKSTADYECSGTTIAPDGSTVEWSGTGSLQNNIDGSSHERGFIASLKFDPENQQALLSLTGGIQDGLIQTIRDQNGHVTTLTQTVIFGLDKFDGTDPVFPSSAVIHLGANHDIPKGSSTATTIQTYYSALGPMLDKVTAEWDTIACQSPPRDDSGRAAKPTRAWRR